MEDYSYLGVGKWHLREVGAAAGLMEIGNVSISALNVTEDVKELKDYTAAGGGTYNEVRRVQSVELAITVHDLSASNLALALRGTASANSTSAVVDESHVAYVGAFIPTNKPPASITSVKKSPATALTEGVDYEVVPGGINILEGGSPPIVANGDTVLISYTPAASDVIEALTKSGKEYEVFFSGINEARSGKLATLHGYRWKPGPASSVGLIGDDYAGLELTGKLLKDSSKTGTGISQYFKQQIVN